MPANNAAPATSIALRRQSHERGNGVLHEDGLGINGKRYLALFAEVYLAAISRARSMLLARIPALKLAVPLLTWTVSLMISPHLLSA